MAAFGDPAKDPDDRVRVAASGFLFAALVGLDGFVVGGPLHLEWD